MNPELDNIDNHIALSKEMGLKPMFSKQELQHKRDIINSIKLIFGKID